jgi:hypothetical protein
VQPASIGFVGEQYKVTQGESLAATTQFGAGPLLQWRKSLYDDLLRRRGYPELEARNVTPHETGAAARAARNEVRIRSGQCTPNEARAEEGLEPLPGGDTLFLAGGLVPLEQAAGAGEPADPEEPEAPAEPEAVERALRRWERKALNRLRATRSAACDFVSEALPTSMLVRIVQGLEGCPTPEAVRAHFQRVVREWRETEHPRDEKGRFVKNTKQPGSQLQFPKNRTRDRRRGEKYDRKKSQAILDMEAELATYGIPPDKIDLSSNPLIAEWIYHGLREAHASGLHLPVEIYIDEHLDADASVDARTQVLSVNPYGEHFRIPGEMRKRMEREREAKYSSSEHPRHIVRHEIGHLEHVHVVGASRVVELSDPEWLVDQPADDPVDREAQIGAMRAVATRVSIYAANTPADFVAEVYAGHWGGTDYNADVMDLYQKLGGPALPPRRASSTPSRQQPEGS